MKDFGRRPHRGTRPAKELLLLWWLIAAAGGCVEWDDTTAEIQGPYSRQGPNYTDFATFNSLSNAPVADPLRPNFGLGPAYLGQLLGSTAPKWLGVAGKSDGDR